MKLVAQKFFNGPRVPSGTCHPLIQRRNLFHPAPYIHASSTVSVRALLRLRTQASPHIPAHCKLSRPTAGPASYRAFQERPCPACPLAVGDSSHYLLTCTLTHSAAADAHRPITTLLHHLRLPKWATLPPSTQASILAGSALPPMWKKNRECRTHWISQLTPHAALLATRVETRLGRDPR